MNRIQSFLDQTLTELLISITPFVASIIPAIFLYLNLTSIMLIPWYLALLIAAAAEGIGVGSIAICFKAIQFNKRYKDEKNHVYVWPPLISYGIYLAAIIVTNAILEAPGWHERSVVLSSIAKGCLSLLSLSGALMIATNNSINLVVAKNKPKERKAAVKVSKKKTDRPVFAVKHWDNLTAEMKAELSNGHAPDELTAIFPQVTARTIRRWKEKIE